MINIRKTFDNKTHLQLNLNRSRKAKTESTKTRFRFDKTACFVSLLAITYLSASLGCNLISSKTEKPPHNKQMAMKLNCIGKLFGQRVNRGVNFCCYVCKHDNNRAISLKWASKDR